MATTKKPTTLEQLRLLAQRTEEELAKRDQKIEELTLAGGEPNVLEGVKVNGAALAIADKLVDILIATGGANGTIKVNNVDVAVKGLAALAYKSKVSIDDLSEQLVNAIDSKASKSILESLSGKVQNLISTDTGKTIREIANDELAKQLVADGAAASLDTLAEIAAWIQDHPDDASAMNQEIEQNAKDIGDLVTLVGTIPTNSQARDVIEYIRECISDWDATIQSRKYVNETTFNSTIGDLGDSATVIEYVDAAYDALDDKKVDKVTGKGLSTNDYTTAEKNKLSGITAGATKVESSTNGYIKINGTDTLVYSEPSDVLHGVWSTDTEVTTMLTEVFGA